MPCVFFADELLQAYPDAKVVLTERDVDGWVKSVQHSIVEILSWRVWYLLRIFDSAWTNDFLAIISSALRIWSGGHPSDVVKVREGYLAHNQHIRDTTPKDRLLVWHPRDGWEPLCGFLSESVPAEPVPKINEGMFTAQISKYLVVLRFVGVGKGLAKVVVPAAVAWAGWAWWRWYT